MLIKETLKLNFESVSRSPIEERYALEELLMNAVSVGDTKNALEYQRRFREHHLVPRTDDLVRNSQNMMIILNTLLRKAAQAGGPVFKPDGVHVQCQQHPSVRPVPQRSTDDID